MPKTINYQLPLSAGGWPSDKKYKWFAIDKNRQGHFYTHRPVLCIDCWLPPSRYPHSGSLYAGEFFTSASSSPYEKTLVKRV